MGGQRKRRLAYGGRAILRNPLEPWQSRTVGEMGNFLWLYILQRIAPHNLTVGRDFETLSDEGRSIERSWLVQSWQLGSGFFNLNHPSLRGHKVAVRDLRLQTYV